MVYGFTAEKLQEIQGMTLQFYNYLYIEKLDAEQGSNQLYQSEFILDFSKIQMLQLHNKGDFWPLVIRLENQSKDKTVMYYYFEYEENQGNFQPKLKKQKMERNFNVFLIEEIYGIAGSGFQSIETSKNVSANISDQDKECIVCFEQKIDTIIMPCRHMCICVKCAQIFRNSIELKINQSTNIQCCPICRTNIESFIQIPQELLIK